MYTYHKLPLYMQVAFDLYVERLSLQDVAFKYNRTALQIRWLISKCVRPNLPNIWIQIKKHLKQEKIADTPIYIQIAADMCQNKLGINDIMKKYNRSRKQINDSLQRISRQLPRIYNFIDINILQKENKILLQAAQKRKERK